jgi:hypothetical protein
MGQQQLLLLVLSTVIVGLATVAGIQAFSENQAQASQDALVQRGTSIASDIQGLNGKPTQMGGIDVSAGKGYSGASDIVNQLGYDGNPVEAQGAGNGGRCEIDASTSGQIDISCASDDASRDVKVTFDPAGDPEVSTSFGSYGVSSL